MSSGFHLPHNAVLPEELKFIISLIDVEREYYLYDDLKAMMFEEEIKQDVFKKFHPKVYSKYMNNPTLCRMYEGIKNGELKYENVKNYDYTTNKTVNGCWNEYARDYFEFIAFMGLMPSYYKGKAFENEKRYYVSDTLKKYRNGTLSYADILFKMKFRNASKNEQVISQYDVKNRPFVVAIKLLQLLKDNGKSRVLLKELAYLIKNVKDENLLDDEEYRKKLLSCNLSLENEAVIKEASRGATFLKQHLQKELHITIIGSYIDLEQFDINRYHFKNKAIFIEDVYGDYTVTPMFIRALENPSAITNNVLKQSLKDLGLINDTVALVDFNKDTDLADRGQVLQVNDNFEEISDLSVNEDFTTTEDYKKGLEISQSSNGTRYEEFLFAVIKNKFGEENTKWYGANTMGQRLSDITCDVDILSNDGMKQRIKIIFESKAGSAIRAFDERKEKNDIINTLNEESQSKKFDGIWYIVVDSNKIPNEYGHGGSRENAYQMTFRRKLLDIYSHISMQTSKMTLVTAFSYHEFMKFMNSIKNSNNQTGLITEFVAKDFWTWSNKFVKSSFVEIIA